jgi:ribA/ribD-fused uncharacterized protein
MAVISFTKVDLPYGWLGNMAPFPITYNGKIWKTSEALFQALRFSDSVIQELIREQKSPMAAKMKAKGNKDSYTVVPMSDADVENMKLCLDLKFNQHNELRIRLIKTTEHRLVEDIGIRRGERHQFWGAYRKIDNTWVGQNKMGELLMELRARLKENESFL